MASLRSIILDGRLDCTDGMRPSAPRVELKDHRTILVNAQKVYENLCQTVTAEVSANDFREVPRPRPPYQRMWIESLQSVGEGIPHYRAGVLIKRDPYNIQASDWTNGLPVNDLPPIRQQLENDHPAEIMTGFVWTEVKGSAIYVGTVIYWLNEKGDFQFSSCHADVPMDEQRRAYLLCQELWLLHAMARLNCHNVELRPIQGQRKLKPGRTHAPFSVWHEIVVKPSLLIRRAQAQDPAEAEKHAVRLHRVRGHYADYRKGAGLFGKYKVLIWVEEHEAGDADLGTVVSSYRVE